MCVTGVYGEDKGKGHMHENIAFLGFILLAFLWIGLFSD